MWSSPQYYSYPYLPQPNPPSKKGMHPIAKILIVLFILGNLMFGIFFVYVMVINPDFLISYVYNFEGDQTYNGNTSKTEIMSDLNNASFYPRENPTNMGDIKFYPFCGGINTSQANASRRLMDSSYTSINGNTITVRLRTRYFNSSMKSRLEQELNCVMNRMKSIYVNQTGLIFINQEISQRRHDIPGFELTGFIIAVAVIIYYKKCKMSKNEYE